MLDHMMSVLRETSSLSVRVKPIIFSIHVHIRSPDQAIKPFDTDPYISSHLSCHQNVETLIPLANNSFSIEVHQYGYFYRNSSDDLVGLDEWQEADGFTAV
ncbi:Uncharacterized protein Adt_33356 [Abeliophyllum distichum]|uniref:Uncharacterized protein n=1 Tax=Abeliophyllum distichum TaxID=126358 RepID=A0ABD1QW08_9LAMI